MFKYRGQAAPAVRKGTTSTDAVFLGWQPTRSGEVFALYDITATGHPSLGSTVTGRTLRKLNLQVPGAPLPGRPVKKL
jgi:hypothetical protein